MLKNEWALRLPLLKKLQGSPFYYMKQVIQNYEKNMLNILVDFELTMTQIKLLVALAVLLEEGTPVNQGNVANLTHCDKNTVSAVLRALEKRGYIARSVNPIDKRAKSLVITDEGSNLLEKAFRQILIVDDQFFDAGSDRDELIGLLKKYL